MSDVMAYFDGSPNGEESKYKFLVQIRIILEEDRATGIIFIVSKNQVNRSNDF